MGACVGVCGGLQFAVDDVTSVQPDPTAHTVPLRRTMGYGEPPTRWENSSKLEYYIILHAGYSALVPRQHQFFRTQFALHNNGCNAALGRPQWGPATCGQLSWHRAAAAAA